jgi:hypothetical protein
VLRSFSVSITLVAIFISSVALAADVSGVPSGIERDNLYNLNPVRPVALTPPEWAQDIGLKQEELESYIKAQLSKSHIPTASINTASAEHHKGGTLVFGISGQIVYINTTHIAYLVGVSLQLFQRARLESDNRLSLANTWAYTKIGIYGTGESANKNVRTCLDILLKQFIADYQSANRVGINH